MKIRLYLDEDAMDGNLVWALRVRGLDVSSVLRQAKQKRIHTY